jgi:hypothetical protein
VEPSWAEEMTAFVSDDHGTPMTLGGGAADSSGGSVVLPPESRRPPHRMVLGLPTPSGAGSRRDGHPLRR